ncbi:uncharacterized protein [Typha latifolia]|uniref:uncharacterized protein n=1 Tax=Typha latifolia TaxID=4733 RepID=UPI003C2DB308
MTNNTTANLAATRFLQQNYRRIYCTSCAAHCIDLMLEMISKEGRIKSSIERGREITVFIYEHHKTLSLICQFTQKREIIRPAIIRFATSFLTLQSILKKKEKLRLMFTSNKFLSYKCKSVRHVFYSFTLCILLSYFLIFMVIAHWWSVYRAGAPYLKCMIVKILNLTCSSSKYERNWSSFEQIHSKKRNRLEVKRLNDLIYVQFNTRIKDQKIVKRRIQSFQKKEIMQGNSWIMIM